jgi:arylsulfatase A-like enzyme
MLPVLMLLSAAVPSADPARPPNIVFILADDLGYGDLSCYGQTKIKTPRIDQLAAQGVRFTQSYAGSTVCAPSRCALMTGLHTGHCRIRGNARVPLLPEDVTVAEILKKAGYRTALCGKWGLGEDGSTGVPNRKGFDFFYGYLNQTHAHNYYPDFLWRNETKVNLPNVQKDGVASVRTVYAPDRIREEAIGFIEANREKPFFLYFSTILPHANNEKNRATGNGNELPPGYAPSQNEPWPQQERDKAGMIARLDHDVGAVLDALTRCGLDDNTIVFFTSDNGPHREAGNDPEFFRSSGPLRGIKRSLTDGGIRVPMIVRWNGVVKSGTTSDRVGAFWDFLPTAAELAGAAAPAGLDGISIVPVLRGEQNPKSHEFLYWEFHEQGSKQAVRHGNWKAIRLRPNGPLSLYDVAADPHEDRDVARQHPDVIAKIEAYLKTARTESKDWPLTEPKQPKK